MKKSRRAKMILRIMTTIIITPILLVWAICILLYLPPLQRYATDKIEEAVAQNSDYRLSIGELRLSFPLKLTINKFSLSKEEHIIAQGDAIAINISILPLLWGEAEINYILMEHLTIDSDDLIEGTRIAGNVEHFRGVARNINFTKENADIRQLHLNGADINLYLNDSEESEKDSTSTPLDWNINLHKGNIENTRIGINLQQDTTEIVASINKLVARDIKAHIASNIYSLGELQLTNSGLSYDRGTQPHEKAPLEHLSFENIYVKGEDFLYSPNDIAARIEEVALNQPDGININEGTLALSADSTIIEITQLAIKSANGSRLDATATLSRSTFGGNTDSPIKANASAHIDKRDLKGFITAEQAQSIGTLPDSLIDASIALQGTLSRTIVENISATIPKIAKIEAHGELANINSKKAIADVHFDGEIIDTAPFTGIVTDRPVSLSLKGDAKMKGTLLSAGIDIEGDGNGNLLAIYDTEKERYDAKIEFEQFNIASSTAAIPVQNITMRASVSGAGTDIFAPQTYYQIFASIDTLRSNDYILNNVTMSAFQANSFSLISLISNSAHSDFQLTASTHLQPKDISSNTELKIYNLALDKTGISKKEISGSIGLNIEARTNLNNAHKIKLHGSDIVINTPQKRFTPADIDIDFSTSPDSSYIIAHNGDLNINGTLACGYEHLIAQIDKLQEMLQHTRYNEKSLYYAHDYERHIPATSLDVQCGKQNMLHNLMAMNGIAFNDIDIRCSIDTVAGIRARGAVHNLQTADIKLDTVRFSAIQTGENIKYFAGVRSSSLSPEKKKESFRASLYGNLLRDTLNTHFSFTGNDRSSDTGIGISSVLMPEGLNIHILPHTKIIGEEFSINDDNYINIGKNKTINANVRANDKYNSGLHLYTIEDSTAKYDISLELFNINLDKLTSTLPFTPDVAGTLNSSMRLRDEADGIILACDIMGDSLSYDGNYIGNEIAEFVYLPKHNNNHILSLMLYHNDEEYLNIHGDYNDGNITGYAELTKLPLKVMNSFTRESNLNIDGYIDGNITLNGPLETPRSDGFIKFDSVYVDAPLLGTQMRLVDDEVNIKNSKIYFKDFKIYAKGDSPFIVNGDIDIAHIASPSFNLRMQAKNYELINAARRKNSVIYGKLLLDVNSKISGAVQSLNIYGDATVLGSTNITYVMPENSIATNNELDGLVEFVNFNDSTQAAATEETSDLGNFTMSMTVNIEEGAWINADFDSSRDSYINLQGGGRLNMSYTGETGISLTGRYTLNNGEMKYSLPIIPLKTFHISPGSYVNWSGDPMNPTLNITALERVVAPVSIDDGNNQPVAFDVGLILSNSLDNMGLNFTMKAPENATIQDELNSLDAETLNKYAVTMLVTGAYVGSNGGLTVSNALTSFLDAKINDIAGDAMKSVSINVGITDIDNKETGGSYTNYSFSFAKRLWNDRLTIIIGGEVNSGDSPEEESSFINNVSLEWRLTPNGNRYARLFYDKNYESILEGEITEAGVGYVYKRKLNNLNELLYFKRQDKKRSVVKEQKEKER